MSISIWDYEKPLDAVVHDHMSAMVLNHEQQIKDIAAQLLELKQLVTPTHGEARKGLVDAKPSSFRRPSEPAPHG